MVTLTYDDENIPFSDNGLMTLDYTDFQKFMKRYRKKNENSKVRYFTCGSMARILFGLTITLLCIILIAFLLWKIGILDLSTS